MIQNYLQRTCGQRVRVWISKIIQMISNFLLLQWNVENVACLKRNCRRHRAHNHHQHQHHYYWLVKFNLIWSNMYISDETIIYSKWNECLFLSGGIFLFGLWPFGVWTIILNGIAMQIAKDIYFSISLRAVPARGFISGIRYWVGDILLFRCLSIIEKIGTDLHSGHVQWASRSTN